MLDDCSNDNSISILRRYERHPKVSQLIINESNSGSPFSQWKKGIDLALGEWIWIAESDDWADPRFLEELFQLIQEDNNVVLSYCQSHKIDEKGTLLGSNYSWTDDLDKERWRVTFNNEGSEEIRRYLSRKNTIPNASAVLFRKIILDRIDWDIDQFRMAGDWLFWIKVLENGRIVYSPKCLNYFRSSPSDTRRYNSIALKYVSTYEKLRILNYVNKKKLASLSLYSWSIFRLRLKKILLKTYLGFSCCSNSNKIFNRKSS